MQRTDKNIYGTLQQLVDSIKENTGKRSEALLVLGNLSENEEEGKGILRHPGMVQALIDSVKDNKQSEALVVLTNLTRLYKGGKILMFINEVSITQTMIDSLKDDKQSKALDVLVNLSSKICSVKMSRQPGLVQALLDSIKENKQSKALLVLGNLSNDNAIQLFQRPGLIQALIDSVKDNKDSTALGVLGNLASKGDLGLRMASMGIVELISPQVSTSLQAMLVVVLLVGKEEEGPHAGLFSAELVVQLVAALEATLNGEMYQDTAWSFVDLLQPVRIMLERDANKKLLHDLGIVKLLLRVIEERETTLQSPLPSSAIDRAEAVALSLASLVRLSFLPAVVETLNTSHCKELIKDVATSKAKGYKDANLLLWRLEPPSGPGTGADKPGIFVSYSWAHQTVIKRLVQYLKSEGFIVWFDLDEMHGDTIDAMANGVDDCKIFLMDVSTSYKESDNCHNEGLYAQTQKKVIIPLMMEKGYRPNGWLGFILGGKLWHDFANDKTFDESTRGLVKEIMRHVTAQDPAISTASATKSEGVVVWSNVKVEAWLAAGGIVLAGNRPLGGLALRQLASLAKSDPMSTIQYVEHAGLVSYPKSLEFIAKLSELQI